MGTWTRWIHICKLNIYYWMLLDQGTSKTSDSKGALSFRIPVFLVLIGWVWICGLPRDSVSNQIAFQTFLLFSYSVCLGCLKPRILTSARWISSWPDIKNVDLTPKANILSNDKAPETYPLMAAIRQSNLYDRLPQEPLDFFRERVVGNNFHFTETLWTSSMGKVSWVAVGCLNQVKERFRPN